MSRSKALMRTIEVCALASELYDVDLSKIKITFDVRGRAAGRAYWERNVWTGEIMNQRMALNLQAIKEHLDEQLDDTIPHEIAHLVCGINPKLGCNHDDGWRRVCIALGGTGKTCHKMNLRGRMREWRYLATCGTEVWLTTVLHNKVQRSGHERRIKKTSGIINRQCFTGEKR